MSETKLKPFPTFATDEEAERFVDEADLSEYDLSGFKPMRLMRPDYKSFYNLEFLPELFHRVNAKARAKQISIGEYLLTLIRNDLGDQRQT